MAPATSTRTVVHALFDYWRENVEGLRWRATALRGERIEVETLDLERGERLGALTDGPLPTPGHPFPLPPLTPDVAGGSDPVVVEGEHLEPVDPAVIPAVPPRPKTVAPVSAWRDYAVARGMKRDDANELSKDELIAKYPA